MQAQPLLLSTAQPDFDAALQARLQWSADTDAAIEQRVADILADVRARGDAAVLHYTQRFDALTAPDMKALELTQAELQAAFESLPVAQRQALQSAAARVRAYHEAQKKACGESWSYRDADGTLLGQKVTALDRVGIYVPGGKAAYPSSVLMNAIPAQVAGVAEILMVVPTPGARKILWCSPPRIWRASAGPSRSAALRPLAPWPMEPRPCPRSTRSPARAMPMWRRPSAACSARSAST